MHSYKADKVSIEKDMVICMKNQLTNHWHRSGIQILHEACERVTSDFLGWWFSRGTPKLIND